MKVCHFTSAHESTDNRIFEKECKSLAKNGYDVYLVASGESRLEDGVTVVGMKNKPASRVRRLVFFAHKVYRTALDLDCDIYHFHDPELLPYGLKLKRKGKTVLFDSHEKYSDQIAVKSYLGKLAPVISKIYTTYEDHVLKKIDGVIFPCTIYGKNPFEGKCRNIEIISNAPRLEELYNEYDPDAEKIENSICYLGSLSESRGLTLLKNAAEKAKATLVLAGPFSPKEYEKEITASESVKYLGILNREGIKDTIQKCKVGMSLLRNVGQYYKIDTLSTKIYEYMSLAVPVIMQDSPYSIKVNEEFDFGICVDPENEEEVVRAITELLSNPEKIKRLGSNGRKAVKEHFNWGVDEKRLLDLYKRVMN